MREVSLGVGCCSQTGFPLVRTRTGNPVNLISEPCTFLCSAMRPSKMLCIKCFENDKCYQNKKTRVSLCYYQTKKKKRDTSSQKQVYQNLIKSFIFKKILLFRNFKMHFPSIFRISTLTVHYSTFLH